MGEFFFLHEPNIVFCFFSALQDLEPQQLLLFVQSFGIPVSSMSKLLQYLDQAVSHDPESLEQNIMDKRKVFLQMFFFSKVNAVKIVIMCLFLQQQTTWLIWLRCSMREGPLGATLSMLCLAHPFCHAEVSYFISQILIVFMLDIKTICSANYYIAVIIWV